jgi:3'(2'), 5'-bisphosphate nucleotidase
MVRQPGRRLRRYMILDMAMFSCCFCGSITIYFGNLVMIYGLSCCCKLRIIAKVSGVGLGGMMYEKERATAVAAVLRAAQLCEKVRATFTGADAREKDDRSPVTIADFGAQAIIVDMIESMFPGDEIVGEEDADLLHGDGGSALADAVLEVLSPMIPGTDAARLVHLLERGAGTGGAGKRFWTLDPIDGTKGFIRGDQYAIALALIEDGEVVLGVLGCPALPVGAAGAAGSCGVLFDGVKGDAQVLMRPLADPQDVQAVAARKELVPAEAVFCESVEKAHTAQSRSSRIAGIMGVVAEPVRIDSQCKYAVVARGDADVYLRLPAKKGYVEKIWDHAAGAFLVHQAGGQVTDMDGVPLDFAQGRELSNNRGIVATGGGLQALVLSTIVAERSEREQHGV